MRSFIIAAFVLAPVAAWSQAPAAGSGGGGGVGASVDAPRTPTGAAPPGTPSAQANPAARDDASKGVIGATANPPSPVPGNTGGADSGVRR